MTEWTTRRSERNFIVRADFDDERDGESNKIFLFLPKHKTRRRRIAAALDETPARRDARRCVRLHLRASVANVSMRLSFSGLALSSNRCEFASISASAIWNEMARVREIYERTGEKHTARGIFGRGRALLLHEMSKLELKVILWDRWRKDLKYLKPNPLFFAKLSDEYWVALTEEEMRAQLDALEGRQDDSAAGALGGD